ncbi:MAG: methyltransferase domain-containing protein [Coriobacteriales bacterium]|nr:methyltransferase domain-containing protein [Coriobacteriales bacterium]
MRFGDVDWGLEWRRVQSGRLKPFDPEYWDGRASDFLLKQPTPYEQEFLQMADLQPGEQVLDVGCGSGTFSIPLASAGHEVVAMDVSSGMLDKLRTLIDRDALSNIRIVQGGWDDDWPGLGILPKSVDVAIASRSLLTLDLVGAIEKLNATARRRVCVTLGTESFPFIDVRVVQAIGREHHVTGDYLCALNCLYQLGIKAELRLIGQPRRDVYVSRESAWESISHRCDGLTAKEAKRLHRFLDEHLIAWEYEQDGQTHTGVAKDYIRDMRWAFISWSTEPTEPNVRVYKADSRCVASKH